MELIFTSSNSIRESGETSTLDISIVVYKKYDEALETVRSIEAHTGEQIRKNIYIIDNSENSIHDEGRENFEASLRGFGDVIYIDTGENLGFGKGHNYTMDTLTSEYFAIVNPDILIEDGVFENIISFMEDDSVGMVIPRLVSTEGTLQDAYRRTPTVFDMFIRMFVKKGFSRRKAYHSMQDMDYEKPFDVPFGQGSFLVIRTALWKGLGGFDDTYFMYMEDADLCRRVNAVSRLVYCPSATVTHRWEKGSHKSKSLFICHVKSMLKYFWKWNIIGKVSNKDMIRIDRSSSPGKAGGGI